MAKVGRGADQYTVRFSDGLRDRIKAASEASGRSMNDLIVAALEEKYPPPALPEANDYYGILAFVLAAPSEQDMRERAAKVNLMLKEANSNTKIRVLDDIGAKVVGSKAIITTTRQINTDSFDAIRSSSRSFGRPPKRAFEMDDD